ncbi:hypothetical protein Tco_0816089 [Tanacetum coccineum]
MDSNGSFMSLFGTQDFDTSQVANAPNVDQLQKQLNKDEFQEDGSMAAFWVKTTNSRSYHSKRYTTPTPGSEQESKIDTGKALDADLVDTESIRTDSTVQDDSSRSGNDTDADDAYIRPIYDEEPMAEEYAYDPNNRRDSTQGHSIVRNKHSFGVRKNEKKFWKKGKKKEALITPRQKPGQYITIKITKMKCYDIEKDFHGTIIARHNPFPPSGFSQKKLSHLSLRYHTSIDTHSDLDVPVMELAACESNTKWIRISYSLKLEPYQGIFKSTDHRIRRHCLQPHSSEAIQNHMPHTQASKDNDLKNSQSKDKGSKSRSTKMDEQSHYNKTIVITAKHKRQTHIFAVIGGSEELERKRRSTFGKIVSLNYD